MGAAVGAAAGWGRLVGRGVGLGVDDTSAGVGVGVGPRSGDNVALDTGDGDTGVGDSGATTRGLAFGVAVASSTLLSGGPGGMTFANTTIVPPRMSAAPIVSRASRRRDVRRGRGSRIGRTGSVGCVGSIGCIGRAASGADPDTTIRPGCRWTGPGGASPRRRATSSLGMVHSGSARRLRQRRRVMTEKMPPITRRKNRITRKRDDGRFP